MMGLAIVARQVWAVHCPLLLCSIPGFMCCFLSFTDSDWGSVDFCPYHWLAIFLVGVLM